MFPKPLTVQEIRAMIVQSRTFLKGHREQPMVNLSSFSTFTKYALIKKKKKKNNFLSSEARLWRINAGRWRNVYQKAIQNTNMDQ